ncbi:MAG: redox-sensing transcriptional repressor Rex [Lachnospiraceae bacterium]|nr:redox-sensing transcriptional repressor Rex [Lachnospiraceae bacterium]
MSEKEISSAVIKRLPRYYRYLGELLRNNVDRISSQELSKKMNVTASQIRQDLNNFGGFGQQGYGYNVEYLHTEIAKILGLDQENKLIIVGAGNLGQALANYDFSKKGFRIIGIFDINEEVIGKEIGGLVVQHIDKMKEVVEENGVNMAALTVPKTAAKGIAKSLVEYGIRAFWNFASIDLQLSKEEVVVENVHLAESLMRLSYNVNKQRNKE